jgi:hypothetical protein
MKIRVVIAIILLILAKMATVVVPAVFGKVVDLLKPLESGEAILPPWTSNRLWLVTGRSTGFCGIT